MSVLEAFSEDSILDELEHIIKPLIEPYKEAVKTANANIDSLDKKVASQQITITRLSHDIFPYNRLDDDEFSQAILLKLENKLMMSNLIFNPHESNSFDLSYCTEFDSDANFFVNKIHFQDMHAHITQKMNWMIKWADLCCEMSSIFHYVI